MAEIFTPINRKVGELLTDVASGRIGLPDLQRPFVWKDSKVRNLLDSMLKGFPIGYIMLWESPVDFENKSHIGINEKSFQQPRDLVIDGQQRLTALLAAIRGVKIKDVDYKERNIKISFNPLTREFAVWSQAYERSAEWISAVSSAFEAAAEHNESRFRRSFIKNINEARERNQQPLLTDDEEILIEDNLKDLLDLETYHLPTLEVRAVASEEDVAEIFVRVNSGGQKLTEKNFIETLLSVYDNDIHKRINEFCRDSRIPKDNTSFNHIIEVDPVHLIRAAVGLAFNRARLRYAYMLLRGKDLETQKTSSDTQAENLAKFRDALNVVTNLNNWHTFMNIMASAGYLRSSLVSSQNAVVFSYLLYLIGKTQFNVKPLELRKIMTRWVFMVTITGYFTDSPESTVERLLTDMRVLSTPEDFVEILNREIRTNFTDDYFNSNLLRDLVTSSTGSPIWKGYLAALNVLHHNILFSTVPTVAYLTPGTSGTKSSIDVHHIFPKNYLASLGIVDDRDRNQIANYTFLDYQTNIAISDDAPNIYSAKLRAELGEDAYAVTLAQNAIPDGFENMAYADFLDARRKLMAQIIRKAFNFLSKD
jgi:hypothetical protein